MLRNIRQRTFILIFIALSGSSKAQQTDHSLITSTFSKEFLSSILESHNHVKLARALYRKPSTNQLSVTATAYTSHNTQTDSTPSIAAWGDKLQPGMKAIAVSRDLLSKYHLKRGTLVRIHGLPGKYKVLDKMNKRWTKKIDIYMGKNRKKAIHWGKKKVIIEWDS